MWEELGHFVELQARAIVTLIGVGVLIVSLLLGASYLGWETWKRLWNRWLGYGDE
jgi:TRAP-type C4-dicarboxylate transport system permease small subunit